MVAECSEPSCFKEAMVRQDSKKSYKAMLSEMESLGKNGTWDLQLPKGQKTHANGFTRWRSLLIPGRSTKQDWLWRGTSRNCTYSPCLLDIWDRENFRIGYALLLVYDSRTRMCVAVLDAFLLRPKFLRVCYLGILQTLAIMDRKWQNVSMDFVFGLPHTQHKLKTVFVTVSQLTKLTHFVPTTNEATAM